MNAEPDFPSEMTADDGPAPGEAWEGWQIRDLGGAEWAMSGLADTDRQLARHNRQHREWVARLEAKHWAATAELERSRAFFEARLREWAIEQRATNPRTATIELPSGRIETELHRQPTLKIADKKAILHWVDQALSTNQIDHVVKVDREVLVSKLRDVVDIHETDDGDYVPVTKNGEIVPGVVIEPPHITARVRAEL